MNNKIASKEIDYVKDNTNSDLNKIEFFEKDFELVGEENLLTHERIYVSQSYFKDVISRLKKNKGAVIGLFFIILIVAMSIIGIYLNGNTYDSQIIEHQNLAPRVQVIENIGILDGSETIQYSSR